MAFDRKKFSGTKISDLKKQVKKDDKEIGTRKTDYISIESGSNKFRIYPPHPGDKSFYVMVVKHWAEFPFKDDDGETEWKRSTMLNSVVHSGTEFDIFDEYVSLAKEKLGDEEMKTVNGMQGLRRSVGFALYGKKIESEDEKFGLLEFGRMVRDGLNEQAIIDDDDEAFDFDPYSDPDSGRLVIISKKGKGLKTNYSVKILTKERPLTDKELEEFTQEESLEKKFNRPYTKDNFKFALKAVEHFDEENDFGLCETEEWIEIAEKVGLQYDDAAVEDAESEEVEDDENEDSDEFDAMDRKSLKIYNAKNKLEIKVFKSTSDDDLRNAIRTKLAELKEEETADEETADWESEEEETAEENESSTESVGMSIEAVKNRLKNM